MNPAPPRITPALLIILDGVGCRQASDDNAIGLARKPNWDNLWANFAHSTIDASELYVGLPNGQMGNSEVGHLNIGAGRVVFQDLTRIDQEIATGRFFENPTLVDAVKTAARNRCSLHILGLLSPGGVHSHADHLAAMIKLASNHGVPSILVHAFLDGRDTPPKSAASDLAKLESVCSGFANARIASIIGRYYAMDRDLRWDRVHRAYDLIVDATADHQASDAQSGLKAAYQRGETDEFVQATAITPPGTRSARLEDGDVVVFMNFRADRARELTRALTAASFDAFPRQRWPHLSRFVCLSSYGDEFARLPIAYKAESVNNGFGHIVAANGLKQLRIAETEKYAHVTYFFNGGLEQPFVGEDRILVPSPKIATYDLKPEMSAYEVTEKLIGAIRSRDYPAIVCNYANGDMVGHTGNLPAAIRAIEVLDECIGRVVAAQREVGGEVLITADHGNAEMMFDSTTAQPHTAHTLNRVPCLYVGRPAQMREGGALRDIAPTLLRIMGLTQPREMTGASLIEFS